MEAHKEQIAGRDGDFDMSKRDERIPISDLMQVQHPGFRAFSVGREMDSVYHPIFFDYCVCVCERFRHHAYKHNTPLITENSLMQIIEYIKQIDGSDDPEVVFPLRENIRNACFNFVEHCEDMGGRFNNPTTITSFYDNLGTMVMYVAYDFAGVEH